jgi:lipopolysaccharide transport system ATP-binding protein
MNDIAVKVENLGKCYQIGQAKSGDFRESFGGWVNKLRGRSNGQVAESKEFWALKDINFEIKKGEAVGIIGRNGAGKSTLLKILSRITEPTRGRFEINGRVSSLLEVGTGFHPELSGRENIYLNGTILGMKRREIKTKFDEIVSFSGVEKFIDTPVKHYSSGMKVRLAFSVAAHLEPEILIIDEVLAVGDAEFQKKCLGKMDEVSKNEGRTVLFVSHNIGAIKSLCSVGLLLSEGIIQDIGLIEAVANSYLKNAEQGLSSSGEKTWNILSNAPGNDDLKLKSIKLMDDNRLVGTTFYTSKPIFIDIDYVVKQPINGARIVFKLLDTENRIVFVSTNQNESDFASLSVGAYKTRCTIPANILNGSRYRVKIHIGVPGIKVIMEGETFLEFDTILLGNNGSLFKEKWPGFVAPKLSWITQKHSAII